MNVKLFAVLFLAQFSVGAYTMANQTDPDYKVLTDNQRRRYFVQDPVMLQRSNKTLERNLSQPQNSVKPLQSNESYSVETERNDSSSEVINILNNHSGNFSDNVVNGKSLNFSDGSIVNGTKFNFSDSSFVSESTWINRKTGLLTPEPNRTEWELGSEKAKGPATGNQWKGTKSELWNEAELSSHMTPQWANVLIVTLSLLAAAFVVFFGCIFLAQKVTSERELKDQIFYDDIILDSPSKHRALDETKEAKDLRNEEALTEDVPWIIDPDAFEASFHTVNYHQAPELSIATVHSGGGRTEISVHQDGEASTGAETESLRHTDESEQTEYPLSLTAYPSLEEVEINDFPQMQENRNFGQESRPETQDSRPTKSSRNEQAYPYKML